jgi:quinohemoprotein ethanol dehydrogenase
MAELKPLDNPALKLDPAEISAGAHLYEDTCSECHGEAVVANGIAPDLRGAPLVLNRLAFGQVLSKGLLISGGMPLFDDLSHAQIDDLYAYIRSVARQDKRNGRNGVDAVLDPTPR